VDAVVLVGGEGTRLRPLTLERPKPVLPLLGRPLLTYVLERLAEAGVTRVIFGCGYLPDPIQACFGARELGLELDYVVEPRPLGTAGGIRHAARGRVSETFLALNGDILADAPLSDLLAAHRARDAVATISLTPVADPSRYGLVRADAEQRVLGFLEKPDPEEIDTDLINAGAYVLEPAVLDLIDDGRAVSIERETFPSLVGAGLFALAQTGYWSDVGTPESYIAAHHDLLAGRIRSQLPGLVVNARWVDEGAIVSPDSVLDSPCQIASGATVEAGARVGAGSSVGAGAEIGARAQLRGSVVQERARVGEAAVVEDAVIGPRAQIGAGAQIASGAVVGPGVSIPAGASVGAGERVFPEGVRVGVEGGL
jgi:mannose-1-phosphate guanylyltransferase